MKLAFYYHVLPGDPGLQMIKKQNSNLIKVVNILNESGYQDGTTIGAKLHLTRSAVWKIVKKLERYDIKIDSVKGKGYSLLEPLILLEAHKIKRNLRNEKIDLVIFENIDSTNAYLKSFKNIKSIKICLAEQQTKGKGRLNRDWHSPFGKNIYLSCHYPFTKDVSELSGLSLVTGLSLIHTLESYGMNDHLYVKWPNDIIYAQKKLSGVLIEIQAETHGISHAVIGIGMNVNMMNDEDHPISQPWTSIQKILGTYIDRNELAARLITNLLSYLERFNAQGFTPFIHEWIRADGLMNQTVTVKNVNQKVEGVVIGINELGHLLLQMENGEVRAISSGDTSIVKKT
jgi:BirA family biotin operon repressor/biotin-[acetyl-CoA-carboxylase] ligase